MQLLEQLQQFADYYYDGLLSKKEAADKVVIALCDCDPLQDRESEWDEFFKKIKG